MNTCWVINGYLVNINVNKDKQRFQFRILRYTWKLRLSLSCILRQLRLYYISEWYRSTCMCDVYLCLSIVRYVTMCMIAAYPIYDFRKKSNCYFQFWSVPRLLNFRVKTILWVCLTYLRLYQLKRCWQSSDAATPDRIDYNTIYKYGHYYHKITTRAHRLNIKRTRQVTQLFTFYFCYVYVHRQNRPNRKRVNQERSWRRHTKTHISRCFCIDSISKKRCTHVHMISSGIMEGSVAPSNFLGHMLMQTKLWT